MSAASRTLHGLFRHFLLSLDLNFRSKQAIVYGYLVPILFLVAYGSVFRAETPALLGQMGQLLTITIMGGACFGMPTALVAERERGIWRRYRLLPVPTSCLVGGVLAARVVIIASAAALQVGLAHFVYHTPLPSNPAQTAAGVLLVTASFLGLGLVVAAIADDVPAVQALGQCLFLPMIMIGGVGIPLLALPDWAQKAAGFMPGRYAVELLQLVYCGPGGISGGGFSVIALLVIGAGAACVGAKLFRWEAGRHIGRSTWAWVAAALSAWVAVGLAAAMTGHLAPALPPDIGYEAMTGSEIDSIGYADLPGDNEFVSRLALPFRDGDGMRGMGGFAEKLRTWVPGRGADAGQDVRNLLCVAGIADVSQDPHEGDIARLVFDEIRSRYDADRLSRILTWIILYPGNGTVIPSAPELGLIRQYQEGVVRERTVLYATKLLGRLRGRIKD
ncbi:MAG TPA: ABC transporter permease [Opitutaceae bacterium]|nr:ABC transporter permease [Opitutaceae bacterium]